MAANSFLSYSLICDELADRGFIIKRAVLDDRVHRIAQKGSHIWITPTKYVQYPCISTTLRLLSINKVLSYQYVQGLGYSVPRTQHITSDSLAPVVHMLHAYQPLIVKPQNGAGSQGIVRDITTESQLRTALQRVRATGADALVQKQYIGEEVRITIIDGKMYSAMVRQTAQVTGDGVKTVSELIDQENALRAELVFPYIAYPQLNKSDCQKMTDLAATPQAGQVVRVGQATLISQGASLYDVTPTLHNSYRDIAQTIACSLNTRFLVVDLLCKNYVQPATDKNYVFLELNTAPALKMYYSLRGARTQYAIVPVLADIIEATV